MFIVRVNNQGKIESYQVQAFPCAIGRAMDNNISLINDSVSGHHARLESLEFGYRLVDLGSTNGIRHEGERKKELFFESNTAVQLGDVVVEMIVEDQCSRTRVVKPPAATAGVKGLPSWLPLLLVLGTVIFSLWLSTIITQYREFWPPNSWRAINEAVLTKLAGSIVMALVASLIVKINVKRYYFPMVLAICIFTVSAREIYLAIESTLMFNLRIAALQIAFGYAVMFAFVFVPIYLMGTLAAKVQAKRRFAIWSALASFGLASMFVAFEWISADGDNDRLKKTFVGYPLVLRLGGEETQTDELGRIISQATKTIEKSRIEKRKAAAEKKNKPR